MRDHRDRLTEDRQALREATAVVISVHVREGMDTLAWRAAVDGAPLRLEHALLLDPFPDFHSGFKLFTRRTAEDVFLSEPRLAGMSETAYYRHAVEAVMTVEALQAGAYLGVVNRSTLNEQPVSAFGLMARERLTADMIVWPCRRLDVPGAFVRQWVDNHLPRLLLATLHPDGRRELETVRRLVAEAWPELPPAPPPTAPWFL